MPSLSEEIFPPERREALGQTEWAGGWGGTFRGFGYAARLLTRRRDDLGPTIDQAGLALFYLQRHRVELGLKVVLASAGVSVPNSHSVEDLWSLCKATVCARSTEAWEDFGERHRELAELFMAADERSYTFRYPVDNKGIQVVRPAFIDFDALEKHVDAFSWGVEDLEKTVTEKP